MVGDALLSPPIASTWPFGSGTVSLLRRAAASGATFTQEPGGADVASVPGTLLSTKEVAPEESAELPALAEALKLLAEAETALAAVKVSVPTLPPRAERGVRVELYGVDLGPGLVELARRRLPQ